MPILTLIAKAETTPETEAFLLDAMLAATKVYNGLLWNLRQEYEQSGKANISRKHLNGILKLLPRAKDYYSLCVQATRDEVIQAYNSFFALRKAGRTQANAPGFRRKTDYSPLRYYDGYGFSLDGNQLQLSLGTSRADGIKSVSLTLQHRPDITYGRVINVLLTYDKTHGLCAHLVVEVDARKALGNKWAAVDLGETQAITAILEDGTILLYNGRLIKSIRRYWQKVRTHVKPPTQGQRKSRRFVEIESKESRQINHLLHLLTKDFVERCWQTGVGTIVIGDLTGIRDSIDYGDRLNQRLHVWPFAKVVSMIKYKAALFGIKVEEVSEAYSSKTCHACKVVKASNRKRRGFYGCQCGFAVQADINGAANIFESHFKVSPLRSSGAVAAPVVLPIRLGRHMVYKSVSTTIPFATAVSCSVGAV